jgi:CHASE2 domain-containing sensor protein
MKLFVVLFFGVLNFFESLNPIELAIQEIDFLDLYYNEEDKKNVPESIDVIFINSGSIPDSSLVDFRNDFANILGVIEKDVPAAIGIDIEFEKSTNFFTDSILNSELNAFPHLVMGVLGEKNAIAPERAVIGDISLIGDITSTKKYYQLKSNDTLSFALAVALEFLKEKIQVPSNPVLIDFRYNFSRNVDWRKLDSEDGNQLNSIPTIEGGDILSNIDDSLYIAKLNSFLEEKIVLIGHLGKDSTSNPFDMEDKHIVPGDHQNLIGKVPTTPGLFIHAQVIEMLINDRLVYEVQGFWKVIIEWILLVLIATIYVFLARRPIWFKPIALPVSFVLIFIVIYTGLLLRDASIYWAVGTLNFQIVFLIEAVEFYEPISIWMHKNWRIKSFFINETHL